MSLPPPTDQAWLIHSSGMQQIASGLAAIGHMELARTGSRHDSQQGAVGLVDVQGPLTRHPTILTAIFGSSTYEEISAAVGQFANSAAVKSIVLRIDSPGGSASGTYECGQVIAAAAKKKPVIAQIDGMACSAALWLASQCSEVVCSSVMSQVGSIGARAHIYDFSAAFEKEGIRTVSVSTGPFKSTGVPGTVVTPEQTKQLQQMVDFVGDRFIEAVASGRKMSPQKVRSLATGAVWHAEEAQKLGLVDRIQPMGQTISAAANQVFAATAETEPAQLAPQPTDESYRQFEKLVEAEMRKRRCDLALATGHAAKDNPELYQAWRTYRRRHPLSTKRSFSR